MALVWRLTPYRILGEQCPLPGSVLLERNDLRDQLGIDFAVVVSWILCFVALSWIVQVRLSRGHRPNRAT